MVGSPRPIQGGAELTDHPSTTNGQLWSTKEPTRADHADHPDERVGLGFLAGKVTRTSRSGVIAGGKMGKVTRASRPGVIAVQELFL